MLSLFYRYRAYVSFLLLSCQLCTGSGRWVGNLAPDTVTSYVYAPGLLGSEILMGRYCPRFIASTGEVVTCSKGIEVIREPARSCNFSEISLKKTKKAVRKARRAARGKKSFKRVFINLLLTPVRVVWYIASYLSTFVFGFTIKKSKKHKTEESLSMYWADPAKINLAQEQDLAIFKQTYNDFLAALNKEDSRKKSVVLYGTSRGSATVFNFTALEHPEQVSAVICEGLFDSIEHVNKATRSFRIRWVSSILHKVSQFDHQGIVPIKLIEQMPADMPILLITSRNDTTVPCECTINVYSKLRATGHDNVHILILKEVGHLYYPHGNTRESVLYEDIVHAFYKKYGLPYIAEYADEGEKYLIAMTQPTVSSLYFNS